MDAEITKLLYIVNAGIDPESVGFNPEYLKAIPWLTKCKIFREEAGKPVVNIPVLQKEEAEILWSICTEAKCEMVKDLKELLSEFFKGKKQELPAHLVSVPFTETINKQTPLRWYKPLTFAGAYHILLLILNLAVQLLQGFNLTVSVLLHIADAFFRGSGCGSRCHVRNFSFDGGFS